MIALENQKVISQFILGCCLEEKLGRKSTLLGQWVTPELWVDG